jgi:L-aminopeptidase/D-esterase-like protein
VDVRGGGTGTRELELLSPLANAEGPSAVLLTGGSAFGLAAADGVVRWLEERGIGHPTPAGVVPLVSAAVVFDLAEGDPGARPGPEQGYAACESASAEVPVRGALGAGTGAVVGKLLGHDRAVRGGVGYATTALATGEVVAAIAVANAFGDVIAPNGELLACVMTDASLDKRGCAIVARMASAGIARAVNPAFTPLDGDVVFCLASEPRQLPSPGLAATWSLTVLGSVAANVTAAAIRDAVLQARSSR